MKKLCAIAEVRSGHPFRGKLEGVPGGDVVVVQMKDVMGSSGVDFRHALRVSSGGIKKQYGVAPQDIVFRSRGQTNTCAMIGTVENPTVVAAPLYTVRTTSAAVWPEYLCWYINQPPAQSHFNRNARGTAGRMIGRDVLEALDVELPALETQRDIVECALLMKREQELMAQLAQKKKRYLSEILMRRAKA